MEYTWGQRSWTLLGLCLSKLIEELLLQLLNAFVGQGGGALGATLCSQVREHALHTALKLMHVRRTCISL